jgi:hypothetical protein
LRLEGAGNKGSGDGGLGWIAKRFVLKDSVAVNVKVKVKVKALRTLLP